MENIWWIKENIDWSNIGVDVVSRPTEIQALNNIAQQAKHIRVIGYDFESIKLTSLEKEIFRLELKVSSEDFDTKDYDNMRIKDSSIRRISKLSGYSEPFVMRKLSSITKKIWLGEVFNIDVFSEKENKNVKEKRYKLTKWWLKYRRTYKRIV